MAAGPGGVTHRCTLLTQGVHPTLFMLGPLKLTPEVSGSSGPHCVEQVDFWGEFLTGGDGSRLRPCRCRNPPPRGTNPIMAMGPAGGTVFPQSSPRERVMQLGGGVRCRTSHRKLTRSDRGEFPVWTPPTPNRTGTTGTRCVHSARFPKMTRRVVQKTENAPTGRPKN